MDATARRKIALERAQTHSPFLRETIRAFPDIAETFATKGAPAAIALSLGIEAEYSHAVTLHGRLCNDPGLCARVPKRL